MCVGRSLVDRLFNLRLLAIRELPTLAVYLALSRRSSVFDVGVGSMIFHKVTVLVHVASVPRIVASLLRPHCDKVGRFRHF